VRNAIARRRSSDVNTPASVVLTPEALFTALLVKEPVTGIEPTKEPIVLQSPNAIISWVASSLRPLQKALAIDTASNMDRIGMNMKETP
jgi:trans-aconitate methyltransferase